MITVVFKSLENSQISQSLIEERFERWEERFPDLRSHKVRVTVEMENSRHKPGVDVFTARVVISGKKFRNLSLSKSSQDLHAATAAVDDGMLELLNRAGDKDRVKSRVAEREMLVS